ncbi:MAG: hypothetical protein ICV67_00610 [Thermoleophilia bacterium]|nr:hypothetical protein [Thermoleophilia bacterium]
MPRGGRLGPRFGLEAGFLIGVAVVLGLLEVSWPVVFAAMAVAWVLVAAVEVALARAQTAGAGDAGPGHPDEEERDPFRDAFRPPG